MESPGSIAAAAVIAIANTEIYRTDRSRNNIFPSTGKPARRLQDDIMLD
jgi:hypothetical protein